MTDTMTDTRYAFLGNLEKFEDDAGRLHVKGLATDASLDLDGQRCDPEWLKSAMQGWFEWNNVREMHGSNAVGTGVSMTQKGTGYVIEAVIIDPLAAEKVKTGVYKGFSIGIKGYSLDKSAKALELAPNGIINGGDIIEISVVDRPANPNAKFEGFTVAKMVGGAVEIEGESEFTVKEVTVEAMVQTDEAVPCDTCSGIGQVLNEGGTSDDFHTCPACNGEGTVGGVNIKPSTNSGPDHEGVVDGELKAAKPDPDCKTCKGKGTIKDGHVKCPDCVQGKSLDVTDYFGYVSGELDDETKSALAELPKKDYSDKQRARLATTGQALPGGGFPIVTVTDLKNAIKAVGRAKNPAAAKAHIKRRAKALGREDLIPDNWKSAIAELVKKYGTTQKGATDDTWLHDPAVLAQIRDGVISCISAELSELSQGEMELWDISDLLEVLSGFMAWWSNESWGGETAAPYGQGDNMDLTTLGVAADLVKSATKIDATDADRSALAQGLLKALGVEDIIALEKSARDELAKKVTDLTSEIEQMKTWAAPREIAIRRTNEQKTKAAQVEVLLSEAQSLEDSAKLFDDRAAKSQFMAEAAAKREKAQQLQNESE